jgi:trk system potassium uptake protein
MNIVILGAGEIGQYLAKILSQEQHNIFLIDSNAKALEQVQKDSDVSTIHSFGTNWKVLNDLTENDPDLFIAMTGNDEVNLISCSIAKNLGYPKTVARVKEIGLLTRSRLDFGRMFYVDHFIGSELIVAQDLLKNIINPGSYAIENFAHGAIQMRTLRIPKTWKKSNLAIKDLDLPKELIIALIRRKENDQDKIIFPHGDDNIFPNDEITIIGETKTMYNIQAVFEIEKLDINTVTIVGGTSVAAYLAFVLNEHKIEVKLLEKNEETCDELSRYLPSKTTVFNQNGKNIDFINSEKLNQSDAFVTCTSTDESNLLISLIAKQAKCKKIITVFSDITIGSILRDLDISFAVSEKVNIINRIFSIIHAKSAISIASLCDNNARVVEIKVSSNSDIVGIPLADLSAKLPKDLIIAAIENKGRVMIGKGDRIISPHDTIIVITSPDHMNDLSLIF